MKSKMRNRILALLLVVAMVMNGGVSALASGAAPTANEETGHVHTDECYTEEKTVTCGQEEIQGHTHGEGCYTTTLNCGSEEFAGHSHGDSCYTTEMSCGIDEHTHDESCSPEGVSCDQKEHKHGDECKVTKLNCDQEETAGHTHEDGCYTTAVTCSQEELAGHTHTEECYTTTKTLTCTIPTATTAEKPVKKTTCEVCGLEECTCEKEEVVCEVCGLEECTCEKEAVVCEVCGLEECTCEKEVVACEVCGLEECTCEKEAVICEVCGLEECTCEKEVVVCEVCGLEECTCEKEEPVVCACGNEACECENCEEGCSCTEKTVESLEYADDDIKITVTALEEGAIPAEASLKVTPIEKRKVTEEMSEEEKQEVERINAEYALTEEKLEEKMQEEEETELAGFLVYDITFVTEDGTEIEPNGEVKVTLEYVNAVIPEEVEESKLEVQDVTVIHLEEDENGEVKDVVDMKSESEQLENISTTSENAVETAEFKTASFSKFVITWVGTTITLDAMCVNNVGEELVVYEVNKEGEYVKDSDNNNVPIDIIRRVLASPEKDLRDLNIYIQGYNYTGAYIKMSDQSTIEDVQQISYDENDGWKYKVNGKDEENLLGSATLYLEYTTLDGSPASKINTIGIEDGITLNLYNYTSNVNSGKKFVFRGTGNGYTNDAYTPTAEELLGADGYKPGILDNKLDSNGNPKLSSTYGSESLAYLFDNNTNGVTAYTGLSGLFRKTSDGWFVYDSAKNHAQLNEATKSIDVYDATLFPYPIGNDESLLDVGGFLPFNSLPSDAKKNGKYYLTKTSGNEKTFPDYWLGLNLVTDFEQPVGGKVNSQDMVFSFSGDDDMWVFIDGNLVLDIGGTHGPLGGSINFATGEVNVLSEKEDKYGNIAHPYTEDGKTPTTYIGEMYKSTGGYSTDDLEAMFDYAKDAEGNVKTDAQGNKLYGPFKANTPHTMKVFYFERATSQSNCKIEFNIQPANFGEVDVEKEITSHSIDLSNLAASTKEEVEFEFLAEYKATGTTSSLKAGIPYELITKNADGTETTEEKVTEAEGKFYLKTGQTAKFKKLRVGGKFEVTEVDVPGHGCDKVTVTSPKVNETKTFSQEEVEGATKYYYTLASTGNKVEITGEEVKNLSTGVLDIVSDLQTVKFENSADLKGHFVIKKLLERYNTTLKGATFVFDVVAQVGEEVVYHDVVAMSFDKPETLEHKIDNLPAGAVVTVTEVYKGASYENTLSPSGSITIPADCNVTANKATEVVFEFKNDYVDGRLNSGSSVVNTFTKSESVWSYTKTESDQATIPEQPATGGGTTPPEDGKKDEPDTNVES